MIPESSKEHPTFLKSFSFAIKGFVFCLRTERNIKVMLGVFTLSSLGALILNFDWVRWVVLLVCSGIILAIELLNTALETIVDLVCPEQNVLAGRAKDIAAAAVFTMSVLVAIIGVILFVTKLLGI